MDKKYLKEHNLIEAHKQFMRLCETSFVPMGLEEDEDDDQMGGAPQDGDQDPAMGGGDPAMGGAPQDGGQDPAMGGADPMGGGDPAMGGQDAMGGDPSMGADPMGGDPSMGGADPMADPMGGEEEDDVIDVDDITNAQEKMNDKINIIGKDLGKTDDRITQLLSSLEMMEKMIDKQNSEIEAFKQEFEKRNPTQTEKLNLRSLDSYPFNVNPKDYWKENGIDSNYTVYSNNEEPTNSERSLEITNSDVDDFSEKEIQDSFDITDDMRQTIEKIFGI